MRAFLPVILGATLLCAASASFGQTPPEQPAPPAAESTDQDNPNVSTEGKRRVCQQEGRAKNLRGPNLADHVAICLQEARLTCLKQAVEQKVRGAARRDFISKCLGS